MTSRALERQIVDFLSFLESHTARLNEVLSRKTRRLKPAERDRVVTASMVMAFRNRDDFDPARIALSVWFEDCVDVARYSTVIPDEDEQLMLKKLQPEPEEKKEVAGVWVDEEARGKADPILKPGKDCPPCWRCRYFDGWLPRGAVPAPPTANDGGVAAAIAALDKRKIEIANFVRGHYPEELLED
jgi:hypothetical protein